MVKAQRHRYQPSRRQFFMGVAGAASLMAARGWHVGEAAAQSGLPPLDVPGNLRALKNWRGSWWALVSSVDHAENSDTAWANGSDGAWRPAGAVSLSGVSTHIQDMTSTDRLVAVGYTTEVITFGTDTNMLGEVMPLRRTEQRPLILYSEDGQSWRQAELPATRFGTLAGVTVDSNGRLLALGSQLREPGVLESFNSLAAASSDGGRSWQWLPESGLPSFSEGRITCVEFIAGAFVATIASVGGPALYSSVDGVQWRLLIPPNLSSDEGLSLIADDGRELVLGSVGGDGARLWRGGGGDWTPIPLPPSFATRNARLSGSTREPGMLTLLGSSEGRTQLAQMGEV